MLPEGYTNYDVEVFHKGEPQYVVSINENSEEHALRRAKSAIWMMALKDGREWEMDDITTGIYNGVEA